ncbi:MoaD/ThiS family protein [Campylobacter sp. 19-13652]|uniref:MoaD/ThiS family protein n=1 Tax=Campylobacter sp. 19-13652 TaxID=2840180 RepID=UPI001C774B38|nr:MoaD/ThiS family protein [Campylobacter sp. 19-13652]BCX79998.1 molybdenum cofactor biosynthesis protein MoaD [Campylobacter sp. 19-13652]
MVTVEFLGPIARESISVEAANLRELRDILAKDSEIKEWLKSCAVAVNDELVSDIDTELKNGDRVSLLPPVCGG